LTRGWICIDARAPPGDVARSVGGALEMAALRRLGDRVEFAHGTP